MEHTEQPAAPDTATIAANALSTLEAQQSSTPEPAPSSATPAPTNGTPPAPGPTLARAEIDTSAEMKWLQEQGHGPTKTDGRANWLPVSTVAKMLNRHLDHHRGGWNQERDTWQNERQVLLQHAERARQFQQMLQQDPRAVLTFFAQQDPRWRTFIEQQQPPPEAQDPEPEPDLDLGNGRMTYSLDGIRKVRAWERRQMERAFNERMAPFAERVRQDEQRKHAEHVESILRQRTQSVLTRAKAWPKWSEYEPEILKVLQADSAEAERTGGEPQLTVHDAYMQVAMPFLTGDHNTVRESVLRELNGAPRSTSVGTTGAEPIRKPGPTTVEEIARRAYARLDRG